MDLIFQEVDLNVMCAVFLLIITLYITSQLDLKKSKNKYILATSYFAIFQLLVTALIKVSILEPTIFNKNIIYYLYVCSFLNTSVIITSLSMFVLRYEEETIKESQAIKYSLRIPIVLVGVMLLLNAIYDNFFIINSHNVIEYRKYFNLLYFTITADIFILFIGLIINRKYFLREDYSILVSLEGHMLIALIIDILLPKFDIIWPIVAFNLCAILIGLRKRMVAFDRLTHAYIRENFEKELENKINKAMNTDKKNLFSLMFIDLDEFKQINDTFGHSEGDYVLRKFVKLLYEALGNKVKVVRFGGDEFIVYLDTINKRELSNALTQIAKVVNEYNENSGKRYNIKYSISAGIFNVKYKSLSKFLRKLDNEMYKSKKSKKERYDRLTCRK